MKLYTRAGDTGQTRLYGKVTTTKSDVRVEAYGDLDDTNALIGYFMTYLSDESTDEWFKECQEIQQDLFDCIHDLATVDQMRPYHLTKERVDWLEERIDALIPQAPPIKRFIIPGGSRRASLAHRARTKVRQSERWLVHLAEATDDINPVVLQYVNRLSDYFFALSRALNAIDGYPDVQYKRSPEVFNSSK